MLRPQHLEPRQEQLISTWETASTVLRLGLPVVATDFSSSASAMPPGTGLIVPRSIAGVESGLNAFLAGEVPNPPFDPVAYNQQAVSEFYQAIGADQDLD